MVRLSPVSNTGVGRTWECLGRLGRVSGKQITRPLSCMVLALLAAPTIAQVAPNAGQLLQGVDQNRLTPPPKSANLPIVEEPARPALQAPSGVKFQVTTFRFSKNKAFSSEELAGLLADLVGKELTLADLDNAAARISRYYRQHGYFVARAYLPAQTIEGGVVEISVLEGVVGSVAIANQSLVRDETVAAYLGDVKVGEPLQGSHLERGLLLLNNLPGVNVQSTLKPGASVGTTDLDIRVSGDQRYTGSVSFDNYGSEYTGANRAGVQLGVNNPLHLGDSLDFKGYSAGNQFNYGRLAYQLPIGGSGFQVGTAYSSMNYRLGGTFANLDASGTAYTSSLYALYPLYLSRTSGVNIELSQDHKILDDRQDVSAVDSSKTADVTTLGISGNRLDTFLGGGHSAWSLAFTSGNLNLDPVTATQDAAGHQTAGSYQKGLITFSRVQQLPSQSGAWSLFVQATGQQAGKNLDSSEKLMLGGPQAVRAYPQGEAPVDDGWLATIELRYALSPDWQLSVFGDGARGSANHSPIPADINNTRNISGAGLGVSYYRTDTLSLNAVLAWRTDAPPTSDTDQLPRFWLTAQKNF